jgi:hypothetical protein
MIETLLAAFAFGTFWFWLLATIASVIIISCVENEHYPTPSIVAILLGVVYWKAIVAAPWHLIALVAGVFVLIGLLWSVFKWFRHVNKTVAQYRNDYGTTLDESRMDGLKRECSAYNHKAMITGWIAFWPWSLLWSLTGDFFSMLYDAMTNIYQKISDHGVSKFTVAEKPKKEIITDAEPMYRRGGSR